MPIEKEHKAISSHSLTTNESFEWRISYWTEGGINSLCTIFFSNNMFFLSIESVFVIEFYMYEKTKPKSVQMRIQFVRENE